MQQADICIVGAGPGGATAALHLAKKGIRSVLVDKAVFPRDKICGDALSGKVVGELKRIHPDLPRQLEHQTDALPSWGIRFVAPNGRNLNIPFRPEYDKATEPAPGYVLRRQDFDAFLVEEVRQNAHIDLREGLEVDNYQYADDHWALADKAKKTLLQARLLIIANGAQSNFSRKVAGLPIQPAYHCAGLRAYYQNVAGLDAENFIELHFLKNFLPGYFWIFPLAGGYANVGVGMLSDRISRKKLNLKNAMLEIIRTHPELQRRFAQAQLVGDIKGYGLPLGSRKRPISGAGYLLTGDAAHLIDPFSGEGVSNAMISGRWAAEQAAACLEKNDFSAKTLQGYDAAVYHRLGKELTLSYRMQQLLDYPWLFNFVANKASRNSSFAQMLSCMFSDLDLREQLKKPSFYLSLLFNR